MNNIKTNRNSPCHCGSGKKYKQCCQTIDTQQNTSIYTQRERIPELFKQALKYQEKNQLQKAEDLFQQILSIHPKHIDTLDCLGLLLGKTDRPAEASSLLRKSAMLEPSARHYNNLAQLVGGEEGIELTRKAISQNPADAILHSNLGFMLTKNRQHQEAITCFHKALTLNSKQEQALSGIGNCLLSLGRYTEAINYLQQAILVNPNQEQNYKTLLFWLCFERDAFPKTYLQIAHRLNILWQKMATPYQQWLCLPITNEQPMRIGLVTGDLGNHPVGYFLESFITQANKNKLAFFAYSTRTISIDDDLTNRIQPYFHKWHTIRTLSDQQAAEKIHQDGIHILIDLAGYTINTGLSIFAWRPAPVQICWLGYFASTGLSFMDYFLADPIAVPINNQSHFTEKVCYLPHTRLCFTPPTSEIYQEITQLPAIKNGFITFGCFQNPNKINNNILILWENILRNCPNSRILFKNTQFSDPFIKSELIKRLSSFGINTNDVLFEEGSPRTQYLQAYNRVDFMLDTFPYTGGTTTCEALWMGAPTLTLAGNTVIERQGMGLMTCVGLTEWIAHNENEYCQKAITLAGNIQKLSHIKSTLRETMKASPLVDAQQFAKDMEIALLNMWNEKTNPI